MLEFLTTTIVVALVVAFIYELLYKWEIWEYLQVHADSWILRLFNVNTSFFNKLFGCTFCTCWWLSVVGCLILTLVCWDWRFLFVPFCSTPLSRYLL